MVVAAGLSGQSNCGQFNGEWISIQEFEAFKGFTPYYGFGRVDSTFQGALTDGRIEVTIWDDPFETAPSAEQMATYAYICEHQDFIRSVMLDSSLYWFDDYITSVQQLAPKYVEEHEQPYLDSLVLHQLMTPLELHILREHKDGYAYYGVGGHCSWEADEGFGFLLHKDRIVTADVIFVAHETEPAEQDNKTYIDPRYVEPIRQTGTRLSPKPRRPLLTKEEARKRPSHGNYEENYHYSLIKYGYIEDVMSMCEQDSLDCSNPSLLRTAVHYNQYAMVEYLLPKVKSIPEGVMTQAASNKNQALMELLLSNGGDINEKCRYRVPLDEVGQQEKSNSSRMRTDHPVGTDEFISWMRSRGALSGIELFEQEYHRKNYEGMRKYARHVQFKGSYIKESLEQKDDEVALFLFDMDHPDLGRYSFSSGKAMKDAVWHRSKLLIKHCLDKGVDINVVSWRNTTLDVLVNSRKQEESPESINALATWMRSLGAMTHQEIIDKRVKESSLEEFRQLMDSREYGLSEIGFAQLYLEAALDIGRMDIAEILLLDHRWSHSEMFMMGLTLKSKDLINLCIDNGLSMNKKDGYYDRTTLDEAMAYYEHKGIDAEEQAFLDWLKLQGAKTSTELSH